MVGHAVPGVVGLQSLHRHLALLQQLTDALGASDAPTKTSSLSIDFTKGDNGWDLSDASQLSNLVFVGADLSGLGNL